MTDHLHSNICIIPCKLNISASDFATLFFDHWYCENGLPLEIVSDRNKLFVSHFWKTLNSLTGVTLKISSAYHPTTDGSSERTNKTINQCLRYHVKQNQKGWARALPHIHFQLMNTINASTKYSPFQLRMGRSPRLLPPLVPSSVPVEPSAINAADLILQLQDVLADAKDNLLLSKVTNAHFSNLSRSPDNIYKAGDLVMLSTVHHHHKYQ
jgi:hypothetical protein